MGCPCGGSEGAEAQPGARKAGGLSLVLPKPVIKSMQTPPFPSAAFSLGSTADSPSACKWATGASPRGPGCLSVLVPPGARLPRRHFSINLPLQLPLVHRWGKPALRTANLLGFQPTKMWSRLPGSLLPADRASATIDSPADAPDPDFLCACLTWRLKPSLFVTGGDDPSQQPPM